ncbi:hypothetical protein [Chitinophaga flava]|uniref:Uncharacterized protein n=1 Tax=Chitinophaga flava TaxID=2259036 RepID=A0A365XSM5_9BACT|nr:hypothetical protein [Chitinophaga flava]RBL89367.1 hypothetical protein DF182_22870 [Chitinophaga flava]
MENVSTLENLQFSLQRQVLSFVKILIDKFPNPDDNGPYGPYGPVIRGIGHITANGTHIAHSGISYARAIAFNVINNTQVIHYSNPQSVSKFMDDVVDDLCPRPKKPHPKFDALDYLVIGYELMTAAEHAQVETLKRAFHSSANILIKAGLDQLSQ